MNKNHLLDNCLSIIYKIKDDKENLEKLLEFLEEEFLEEQPVTLKNM